MRGRPGGLPSLILASSARSRATPESRATETAAALTRDAIREYLSATTRRCELGCVMVVLGSVAVRIAPVPPTSGGSHRRDRGLRKALRRRGPRKTGSCDSAVSRSRPVTYGVSMFAVSR